MSAGSRARPWGRIPAEAMPSLSAQWAVFAYLDMRGTDCVWFGRQRAIADDLGLAYDTVNKALRSLERDGYIASRRTITGKGFGFKVYVLVRLLPEGVTVESAIARHSKAKKLRIEGRDSDATSDSLAFGDSDATSDTESDTASDSPSDATSESVEERDVEEPEVEDLSGLSADPGLQGVQPSRSERENHVAEVDADALEGGGTAESVARELLRAARRTPSPKAVAAVIEVLSTGRVTVDEVAGSLAQKDLFAVSVPAIERAIARSHQDVTPRRRDHVAELQALMSECDENGNLPVHDDGTMFGGLFSGSPRVIEANVIEATIAPDPSTTPRLGEGRPIVVEDTDVIREGGIR